MPPPLPLGAFAAWAAKNVVIPDAYQRAVDYRSRPNQERALLRNVRRDVPGTPRRLWRRWYRRQDVWEALLEGGEEAHRLLVETLTAEAGARRIAQRELPAGTVEEIVRATVAWLVATLPASAATAVADRRAWDRLVEHDDLEAGRFEAVRGDIAQLHERLDSRGYAEKLARLPAQLRPVLEAAAASRAAHDVVNLAANDDPRGALGTLLSDLPGWLRDADGAALRASAELAAAYGQPGPAATLFEFAAEKSPDRPALYARAAGVHHDLGHTEDAERLLDKATNAGGGLVVDAISAAIAGDAAEVVRLLPEDVAIDDRTLLSVLVWAVRDAGDVNRLIDVAERAVTAHPDSAALLVELGWALLTRSTQEVTASRIADRDRARRLALQARDMQRSWRQDATAAVVLACHAALVLEDYQAVLTMGRADPYGEALPTEAADGEVMMLVAHAATAAGQVDIVHTLAATTSAGFQVALIRAEALRLAGGEPHDVARACADAWALADTEQDKVSVWLTAAGAGVSDLPGRDELERRTDDVPVLVHAHEHLAGQGPQGAVALLRASERTPSIVLLLAAALQEAGEVDAAVDELVDGAEHFADPRLLTRAVELLVRGERVEAAAGLATRALAEVPAVMRPAREFLHRVLVDSAGMAGAWVELERRAVAWIHDLGRHERPRWMLVLALFNQGEHEAAWRIVNESPALVPRTPTEARLWVALASRLAPGAPTAARVLALIDEFGDDELTTDAVGSFFLAGTAWGALPDETVQRFQQLLDTHAVDYSTDAPAPIMRISGSAAEMLDELRPQLEALARRTEEIAASVRRGWPYVLLAAAADRPVTATLVQRAAGCLPIETGDRVRRRREREIARAALGSAVAGDVSVPVVGWYLRDHWTRLASSFSRVELTSPARRDVVAARDHLHARSSGSLYYDLGAEAVRPSFDEADVIGRLREHIAWVEAETARLRVVDWPGVTSLGLDAHEALLPSLTTLDFAKARGIPVWCDDVGLRTLALEEGIATFGTTALLDVLADEAVVPPATRDALLRTLRQEYAVDLELDADWARLSAGSDSWLPGPALFTFTRPATWATDSALDVWSELVAAAASRSGERVVAWVHAGSVGLAESLDAGSAAGAIVALAAKAAMLAALDPKAVGGIAARVREIAREYGLADPTRALLEVLLAAAVERWGPAGGAQRLAQAELSDVDRSLLRDLLFYRRQ